jgi:hypothetical protein
MQSRWACRVQPAVKEVKGARFASWGETGYGGLINDSAGDQLQIIISTQRRYYSGNGNALNPKRGRL